MEYFAKEGDDEVLVDNDQLAVDKKGPGLKKALTQAEKELVEKIEGGADIDAIAADNF